MAVLTILQSIASTIVLIVHLTEWRNPNNLNESANPPKSIPLDLLLPRIVHITTIATQLFFDLHLWVAFLHGENACLLNSVFVVIGLFLCLIGEYIRYSCKQELGRFFTYEVGVSEGQKLVQNGFYTYLMHPSYLGLLSIFLGTAIFYSSTFLLVSFLLMTALMIYRICIEEIVLENGFGSEFVKYKSRRWRMVPYLY